MNLCTLRYVKCYAASAISLDYFVISYLSVLWLKQRYEIVNGIVEAEGVKSENASEQEEGQEKGVYLATDFLILSIIGFQLLSSVIWNNGWRNRCAWILAHCIEN